MNDNDLDAMRLRFCGLLSLTPSATWAMLEEELGTIAGMADGSGVKALAIRVEKVLEREDAAIEAIK